MLDLLNSLAVSFDLPILEWIQANLQSGFLDTIMPIITMLGDGGIFWIVCSVLFTLHPKTRRMGIAMAISMAMGLLICNIILKPWVARMRPYDYQIDILGKTWNDLLVGGKLLVDTPHDYSFPSGHTIACFEASVAIMLSNKKLGIPALIIAILVSFSRMYLYVHYPTDVIASIFLGSLFAVIGHIVAQRMKMPTISKNGKYQRK